MDKALKLSLQCVLSLVVLLSAAACLVIDTREEPSIVILPPEEAPTEAQPALTPANPESQAAARGPAAAAGVDFSPFERQMLELINLDRAEAGLAPLEWASLAAEVARRHSQEMADHGYLSHWNLAGQGPDIRYGLAGGTAVVQENVFSLFQGYADGAPKLIDDWDPVIRQAQETLMQSPGHRLNILDPHHTHVGVGMAYNPETGEFRLAQEFLNRYITFTGPTAPLRLAGGGQIEVSGALVAGAGEPFINLAYEPHPASFSLEALQETDTYTSPASILSATPPLDLTGGRFRETVVIPAGQPGIYHIRLWVMVDGEEVQGGNLLVIVE